ncbi:MAG: nitrogen regulation protein NR(II) [Gammaproteobacteria bacterium]|nr:nitrogen regulation protein NR(II) [Gammaproteobacteria bacterium]
MRVSYHQHLLDSLVTGVIHVDADLRVMLMNGAAADLLQTSPNAARLKPLPEFMPADTQFVPLLQRAMASGEPLTTGEHLLLAGPPPGNRHVVSLNITPLVEEGSGAIIELTGLDRRRSIAEEDRLAAQHQSQRSLVRGLAHEIKNPLGGLRGAAQLLAMDLDDPEHRETIDVMIRETDRLRDLVDNLLGPHRPLQKKAGNIHSITEHVLKLVESESPAIKLRRDYDPSIPDFLFDQDQLTQVLLNLLRNATLALADIDAAEIRCTTRVDRQYTLNGTRHRMICRCIIRDNGPGVPEELRDSLFYPLVTGRPDGTGMGLPIAQDIVQRHGGIIELHGGPGTTEFHVLLPMPEPEANQEESA